MKHLYLALYFTFLSGIPCLLAQSQPDTSPQSARQHSLSLDVKVVGSGGASKVKIGTSSGSATDSAGNGYTKTTSSDSRTTNHSTTLEVNIHNFSRLPDDVQVETYFFARQYQGGKGDSLHDSSTQKFTVPAGLNQNFTVRSKDVASTIVKTYTTGSGQSDVWYAPRATSKVSGQKISGWVVRMIADGKILQIRGSNPRFEEMARHEKIEFKK